jgi:FtsP/CotA-like multicopper oxidase with cupredoxin domain
LTSYFCFLHLIFLDIIFPSFNQAFLLGCPASVSLQEKKRQAALMLMSPGLVMATRIVPRKAIDLLESTVQKWTSHEFWGETGRIRIANASAKAFEARRRRKGRMRIIGENSFLHENLASFRCAVARRRQVVASIGEGDGQTA